MCFYTVSTHSDLFADKGVIYIQIMKSQSESHTFGTHLQAWETQDAGNWKYCAHSSIRRIFHPMKLYWMGDGYCFKCFHCAARSALIMTTFMSTTILCSHPSNIMKALLCQEFILLSMMRRTCRTDFVIIVVGSLS